MAQRVGDVMHRGVEVVRPEDTVKQAALKMQALDVGPLPVCDGQRLVGIITDRDITLRAVAAGRDPSTTPVGETMSTEHLAYCFEDQEVDEAVALMNEREVRRLPVLDRDERLVGMLALADLARGADERAQAEALQGVSQPSEPRGLGR